MNKQQAFLLLLIAASAAVSLLILLPFLEYVLGAIILAYVLHPLHRRLRGYVGHRVSPILLILAAAVLLVVPLVYITLVLLRDINELAQGTRELPFDVAELEDRLAELLGTEVDLAAELAALLEEVGRILFGSLGQAFATVLELSIGLALVLFLVYYVLRDGEAFVAWAIEIAPMPDAVAERLVGQIDRTIWGVIVGHIFVAVLQGVIAGIGLAVAGVPNYVFWTVVMIVLSLLPLIGAFLVWGPAAVYLVVIGQTEWGIFLALYGLAVVSLVDNYARPIVIDREAHLNPGIILIGVFGGVFTIGFTGLFIGPIVLGVLAATLTAFREEYDRMAGTDHNPLSREAVADARDRIDEGAVKGSGSDTDGPDDGRPAAPDPEPPGTDPDDLDEEPDEEPDPDDRGSPGPDRFGPGDSEREG